MFKIPNSNPVVHGGCAKLKRMTSTLAKGLVCGLCVCTKEGIVEPGEELSFFSQVDFVKLLLFGGQIKRQWWK